MREVAQHQLDHQQDQSQGRAQHQPRKQVHLELRVAPMRLFERTKFCFDCFESEAEAEALPDTNRTRLETQIRD